MEQKKKVLIVDDDVIVCRGLRQLIPWETLGVEELLECHNGQEAYEIAVMYMPDLIISDIRMPIMDGLSLCEKLCEIMVDVPVILLSAYEDFEYARTAIRFGVHDYFIKPMNRQKINELIDVIRNILHREQKKRDCYSDIFNGSLQSEVQSLLVRGDEIAFGEFFENRVCGENLSSETKLIFCIGLVDVLFDNLEKTGKSIKKSLVTKENALQEILRFRYTEEILNYVRNLYLKTIRLLQKQLDGKDDSLIADVKQYIEEHLGDDNLSVSYLSEIFHFTPSYFSDLFKKKTQMNPNAYITEVRVRKSAELLEMPFSKVAVVAKQVGFRDSLYFSKVFKKYYGMSPSDYQNLNRE